ncbi:MAG: ABC transporter ATP-binding protein [Chitinispirillaceae bacterium]|jgi:branched-chain amino acid transport system ATP-binding protein
MLRVRNCESGYGKLRVLKGVSLHVGAGEIVTIIGANGAGKTTLLHTIAGILRPRAGDITFNGTDLKGVPAHAIASRGCRLIPEGRRIFAPMTVEENLLIGAHIHIKRRDFASVKRGHEYVYKLFPVLKERRRQLAGTLSGGEQQMLSIGRALMSNPSLMMLDEPSTGLAPLVVKSIFNVLAELRKEGTTMLLIEQNAKAALCIADRGYVMETGVIVLEGSAGDLLNNNDVQRAYLGKEYRSIDER